MDTQEFLILSVYSGMLKEGYITLRKISKPITEIEAFREKIETSGDLTLYCVWEYKEFEWNLLDQFKKDPTWVIYDLDRLNDIIHFITELIGFPFAGTQNIWTDEAKAAHEQVRKLWADPRNRSAMLGFGTNDKVGIGSGGPM